LLGTFNGFFDVLSIRYFNCRGVTFDIGRREGGYGIDQRLIEYYEIRL
jgi:hypothetical protein